MLSCEGFAQPSIEAVGDGVKYLLQVDGQVGALGQVLAQQAIGARAPRRSSFRLLKVKLRLPAADVVTPPPDPIGGK